MTALIVGNPLQFAIESSITAPTAQLGQRGLGYFLIHIRGRSYGVKAPDATMLGCSWYQVNDIIAHRGRHIVPYATEPSAFKIADAVRAARYIENRQHETFFSMLADEFLKVIYANEIIWAPDGDEAFDDGGHVLLFDQGDKVRLIAFIQTSNENDFIGSVAEVWLGAEDYYGILDRWQRNFEYERVSALKVMGPH